MTEDELIKNFFTSRSYPDDVVIGIGDDAAILNVPADYQLVTSVDTLLEEVHFPASLSASDLASRAMAVCVSDLAAMGAQPKWLTLALSLPDIDHDWLQSFAQSLHKSADQYGLHLVGGDTVKGKLAITLNVMGIVKRNQALQRNTAKVDDLVCVSGNIGGAALALDKLQSGEELKPELLEKFTKPQARIELGQALTLLATSCMDISDGILLDCARLASASHVGIQINLEEIPLNPALSNHAFEDALKYATAGDDYELLFTIPEQDKDKILTLDKELNIELKVVGKVIAESGLSVLFNNQPYTANETGYQHFS